jgi:hypothetical protein
MGIGIPGVGDLAARVNLPTTPTNSMQHARKWGKIFYFDPYRE